jgi:FG-GAP-like repeat
VALAVGDLNGDGKPDLAVADYQADTLTVLLNTTTTGATTPTFSTQTPLSTGTEPASVVMADLNGDGVLDLAVLNAQSEEVGGQGVQTISVLFTPPPRTRPPSASRRRRPSRPTRDAPAWRWAGSAAPGLPTW